MLTYTRAAGADEESPSAERPYKQERRNETHNEVNCNWKKIEG